MAAFGVPELAQGAGHMRHASRRQTRRPFLEPLEKLAGVQVDDVVLFVQALREVAPNDHQRLNERRTDAGGLKRATDRERATAEGTAEEDEPTRPK